MTEVVQFESSHLERFFNQPKNSYLKDWVSEGHGKLLEGLSTSYTVLKDGTPLMCCGHFQIWPGRSQAWTVFDQNCVNGFTACFRALKKLIEECPVKRIEIAVDLGDNNFGRRARMLGFELEAPRMEAYLSNGASCALYARVRK